MRDQVDCRFATLAAKVVSRRRHRNGRASILLINEAYKAMSEAMTGRDPTPEDIDALVRRIVANSQAIQREE